MRLDELLRDGKPQTAALKYGCDILVATPGRLVDLIEQGACHLDEVKVLVLDEADRMLDMGFIHDIRRILPLLPARRQTLFFSATMPERIISLSKKYMRDSELLRVPSQEMTTELTDQIYFEVRDSDKFDALTRIIDTEPEFYGIVFSRTKVGVDELVNRLTERGYAAEGLHGDVSQAQREKILGKFRDRAVNILVATDIVARGIDIDDIRLVINFDVPHDCEDYVHRIGRTARANNDGVAITFVSEKEQTNFHTIEKFLERDIYKIPVPAELGEAPEYQPRNNEKGGRKRGGGKSRRGGRKGAGNKGKKTNKE